MTGRETSFLQSTSQKMSVSSMGRSYAWTILLIHFELTARPGERVPKSVNLHLKSVRFSPQLVDHFPAELGFLLLLCPAVRLE
jgi:hypothetical protein